MAEVRSALWKNWTKTLSYLVRRSGLGLVDKSIVANERSRAR